MILRQSFVFVLTLMLSIFAIQAEAAPSKKARSAKTARKAPPSVQKSGPAEVYSATEDGDSNSTTLNVYSQTEIEIPTETSSAVPMGSAAVFAPIPQAPTPEKAPVRATRAAPAKLAVAKLSKKTQSFDTVPAQQTESILRRIRLVEQLLVKFGRAYDYRVYTTRELEGILNQLQAASKPAPAPVMPVMPVIYDSELPPMSPSADGSDYSSYLNQNS